MDIFRIVLGRFLTFYWSDLGFIFMLRSFTHLSPFWEPGDRNYTLNPEYICPFLQYDE